MGREDRKNFKFKGLDDKMSCKNEILILKGESLIWCEGLKAKRRHEGKKKISFWESLKCKLRRRYIRANYLKCKLRRKYIQGKRN